MERETPYELAQKGITFLKSAVYNLLLQNQNDSGLTNAELGRALGIYGGHVRHEGHISRTILSIMESEGVVIQDKKSKRWRVKNIVLE